LTNALEASSSATQGNKTPPAQTIPIPESGIRPALTKGFPGFRSNLEAVASKFAVALWLAVVHPMSHRTRPIVRLCIVRTNLANK
jgi:hypothetical protein